MIIEVLSRKSGFIGFRLNDPIIIRLLRYVIKKTFEEYVGFSSTGVSGAS